jgi:hypothetical protein
MIISVPDLPPCATVVEYRPVWDEATVASQRSLLTTAQTCCIEREAMLIDGCVIRLSAEMREYLEYEATRTGLDVATIYREERAAQKRAKSKLPTREELRAFAKTSDPDPRYFGSDDNPF